MQVTPRKARLFVSRIDPWSVTKAAFMLALAIGIVIVVAVAAGNLSRALQTLR